MFQFWIERFFGREVMPDDISRIITNFHQELRKTDIGVKISKVYYDYSSEQISLIVALNQKDDNAQTCIETARYYASNSVKDHNYKIMVFHKLIDNLNLRDIDGFREFQ
jgi:hypothetical protein